VCPYDGHVKFWIWYNSVSWEDIIMKIIDITSDIVWTGKKQKVAA